MLVVPQCAIPKVESREEAIQHETPPLTWLFMLTGRKILNLKSSTIAAMHQNTYEGDLLLNQTTRYPNERPDVIIFPIIM
jgi:hypothetical protein